ncbi:F0F1 ATP synthase subunit epsilon [Vreelandella boliviensis]|uniref:ATP synthase epsilon chain n=1 Tax=Vreelandella boliviensis LC1 TaxID=1072583 RepID=A0A265DZL0_9GAMM|nr:F0F1 ATP synthase subunit epsilon [Halomonas boliviensis]EHJ91562.1 ATP synthase epsilon chain 2 [Halomonas boliviensis LC1]OZT74784.1 F0F1 ATP synthase subunit epsilon [Halomonas boliviensis LC1]
MKLKIITPLAIIVEEEIDSLRAEDASGSFGILKSHAPFLTSLSLSILSWRVSTTEQFCAVRGGVLTVAKGGAIEITTREAVIGNDLATLGADVLARFEAEAEEEKVEHVESMRLQVNAIRQMISRLHRGANSGEFR